MVPLFSGIVVQFLKCYAAHAASTMSQRRIIPADIGLCFLNSAAQSLLINLYDERAPVQQLLRLRVNPDPPQSVGAAEQVIPSLASPSVQVMSRCGQVPAK